MLSKCNSFVSTPMLCTYILLNQVRNSKTLFSAEQNVQCAFAQAFEYRITHFAHPTPDTKAHMLGMVL